MEENKAGNIPQHVAIILDGNGRWAKRKKLLRVQGHIEGTKRVEEIIDKSGEMGVKVLTLYTFSTENWNRPKTEVSLIMKILGVVLNRKMPKLIRDNIRFQTIGRLDKMPRSLLRTIKRVSEKTRSNDGLILNLAFNYGSRIEIVDAIKKISQEVKNGRLDVENITQELVSDSLYTYNLPDPDLLIRTSGEQRISNFLLWQLSYAEFYFTDILWPDFTEQEYLKAIKVFQNRERRFGNI